MTDSLLLPVCLDRIVNTNGVPYNAAKVYVYDAGTTDLKNVYTDAALSVSSDNPIISDAAGFIPARYIGTGAYKLVITDSSDNLIKSADNLPGALDTSPFQASAAKPVTPTIATAVSRIIAVSELGSVVLADPTGGNITITLPSPGDAGDGKRLTVLHTGTANGVIVEEADTLATLVTSPQAVTLLSNAVGWYRQGQFEPNVINRIPQPQGYLTLVSGTPVITSDQASKTAVYYTPAVGDAVPIFNGMAFLPYQFAELTLSLVSAHTASAIFDVFIFLDPSDGETVCIGTGPSWTTATAGSGARGTGAATTELTRLRGLHVNAVEITARNGSTTYTVAANKATYVGSLFMDGSNGQITNHVAFGQSRKWGVWNAYNRKRIMLKAGDSTSSWNYGTNTRRASNGDSNNSLTVFAGLAEEPFDLSFVQNIQFSGNATSVSGDSSSSIGINSTTSATGKVGRALITVNASGGSVIQGRHDAKAEYILGATIGVNVVNAQEITSSVANCTATFFGSETGMLLAAKWLG